jgi:hypothetical protein
MADDDPLAGLTSVNGRLVCRKCGSTNIGKDPRLLKAVVQELSKETKKPVGKPTTFYLFQCLECGEGYYLEKYEVHANPD